MTVWDWFWLFYIAIGAVFAFATWIAGAHYAQDGPPSGLLAGVFWPAIALFALLAWLIDGMERRR